MVRGSSDFTAAVDTLFYLRGKGDGRFILETAKACRGRPPEPVRVRIEDEDGVARTRKTAPSAEPSSSDTSGGNS
ncbi:MAG TPA: hypothetical protein VGJ58_05145 [Gaiellaceae bacterium]|jgi:hypothetical protein